MFGEIDDLSSFNELNAFINVTSRSLMNPPRGARI